MKSKILKYTSITITSLIFILSLYIMIFGAIARRNNDLLTIFGYSYSAVPTSSMEGDNPDSFDAGSFIITKNVSFSNIKVGDIVVYSDQGILIVHRVVEINEDGSLITKGDNNNSIDSVLVTKDNYKAKMVKSFSFFGLGKKIGTYQTQVLLLLIVVLIGFIIYQIFHLFKMMYDERLRKLREELEKDVFYEK